MNVSRTDRSTAFRIVDANANRASEAFRTIEEAVRFQSDHQPLTQAAKELRHRFATAISLLDRQELLRHRDTAHDVGTELTTPQEAQREDLGHIVRAATGRLHESLRALEEYGKLIDVDFSRRVKSIRYESYQVCREVELWLTRSDRFLETAQLYVLADCQLPIDDFVERSLGLSQAGVQVIQLRDKSRSAIELMEYAKRLQAALDSTRTIVIMNDRVDIAAASNIGVHVGQEDLPLPTARMMLDSRLPIGVSTHSIEQAQQAQLEGASYIGCGPTFSSQTKAFESFPGLPFLRQVAAEISCPAFGIGGINLDRLDSVLETGIRRVAVSHAIWNAIDPCEAAAAFIEQLKRYPFDQ